MTLYIKKINVSLSENKMESVPLDKTFIDRTDEYGNRLCDEKDISCQEKEIERLNNTYRFKRTFPIDTESLKNKPKSYNAIKCPIFKESEYGRITSGQDYKLIGRGKYGLVALVSRKDTPTKIPKQYAMKITYLSSTDVRLRDETYNEVRIQYTLTNLIKDKYAIENEWVNFVKIYDWIQCNFSLLDIFSQGLDQVQMSKYFPTSSRREDSLERMYCITISEYCNMGDLHRVIEIMLENGQQFFDPVLISNFNVQILSSLGNYAREIGYTNFDLHIGNALSTDIKKESSDMDVTHLGYTIVNGNVESKIYASIQDSEYLLFKVGDYGLSHITIKDKHTDSILRRIVGSMHIPKDYMAEGFPEKYTKRDNFVNKMPVSMPTDHEVNYFVRPVMTNIAFDVHKLGCGLFYYLTKQYTNETINSINYLACMELLFPMIYPQWNVEVHMDWYNTANEILTVFRNGIRKVMASDENVDVATLVSISLDDSLSNAFDDELNWPMIKTKNTSLTIKMMTDIVNLLHLGLRYFDPIIFDRRTETGWYFDLPMLKEWFKKFRYPPQKVKDMTLRANISDIDYNFVKTTLPIPMPTIGEHLTESEERKLQKRADMILSGAMSTRVEDVMPVLVTSQQYDTQKKEADEFERERKKRKADQVTGGQSDVDYYRGEHETRDNEKEEKEVQSTMIVT